MTSKLESYFTFHQFAATSHIALRCGLLKLPTFSLTSKEFSGAQQNSFCRPYRSHVSYKQRLLKIGLLPLHYWHEFLDLVYVFECFVSLSDPFISVMNSTRPRRTVSSKGTLLNTIRSTPSPLRTVFTVQPQESGILYHPTSGTLTVH